MRPVYGDAHPAPRVLAKAEPNEVWLHRLTGNVTKELKVNTTTYLLYAADRYAPDRPHKGEHDTTILRGIEQWILYTIHADKALRLAKLEI